MRGTVLVVTAGLALVGCKTVEERHHAECIGYGFSKGTDGYATCRMTLDQNRKAAVDRMLADWAAESRRKNDEFHSKAGAGGIHTYSVDGKIINCSTFGTMTTCR